MNLCHGMTIIKSKTSLASQGPSYTSKTIKDWYISDSNKLWHKLYNIMEINHLSLKMSDFYQY